MSYSVDPPPLEEAYDPSADADADAAVNRLIADTSPRAATIRAAVAGRGAFESAAVNTTNNSSLYVENGDGDGGRGSGQAGSASDVQNEVGGGGGGGDNALSGVRLQHTPTDVALPWMIRPTCMTCKVAFSGVNSLRQHLTDYSTHVDGIPFCLVCNALPRDYYVHMAQQSHRAAVDRAAIDMSCPLCFYPNSKKFLRFSTSAEFDKHVDSAGHKHQLSTRAAHAAKYQNHSHYFPRKTTPAAGESKAKPVDVRDVKQPAAAAAARRPAAATTSTPRPIDTRDLKSQPPAAAATTNAIARAPAFAPAPIATTPIAASKSSVAVKSIAVAAAAKPIAGGELAACFRATCWSCRAAFVSMRARDAHLREFPHHVPGEVLCIVCGFPAHSAAKVREHSSRQSHIAAVRKSAVDGSSRGVYCFVCGGPDLVYYTTAEFDAHLLSDEHAYQLATRRRGGGYEEPIALAPAVAPATAPAPVAPIAPKATPAAATAAAVIRQPPPLPTPMPIAVDPTALDSAIDAVLQLAFSD